MRKPKVVVLFALVGILGGPGLQSTHGASDRPLLSVLNAELERNFEVLKKEHIPAYFMSYTLHDERTTRLLASFGALERSDDSRSRSVSAEVRVGDHFLDNTHPIRGDAAAGSPRVARYAVPLTDAEKPIQLALWRATDRAFKQASEALTRVRTNVAAKVKDEDPLPDFSYEGPQVYAGTPVSYTLDTKTWEARLRRISAPFAEDPLVFRSEVSLSIEASNRSYVNSDGSRIATGDLGCRLFIQAMTKAADGMELPLFSSYFARSLEGLPDETKLMGDAREMMRTLVALRNAPLVDPFSGPAILSGRAAGVFFHEIFGHRVEGHRQRDVSDAQTFTKMLNAPILPSFLSVVFDPTLDKRANVELMGSYLYDDQGVKARSVTVVDHGVLKTFLLDRAPIRGFPQSNGHGRAEPGFVPTSRQSNLIVESSRAVPAETLMNMLKEEARKQGKPFGLYFEDIQGGFTTTNRGAANAFNVLPNVVYRVYTDSRPPELVRGVDLIGTPLSAFGKVVATGDTVVVFNGICGAESGGVPVSASSPPLLVSEVEVQKKAQSQEVAPILRAPARPAKS